MGYLTAYICHHPSLPPPLFGKRGQKPLRNTGESDAGGSHKNKPSPFWKDKWVDPQKQSRVRGVWRSLCRVFLHRCVFQMDFLFLAAGRCVCVFVELGVCNSRGWKYLGFVPCKWSYISSVDGRGATSIKKPPSVSAPIMTTRTRTRHVSQLFHHTRWCTPQLNMGLDILHCPDVTLEQIWVASDCGICRKSRASEKKDPVTLLKACRGVC